MSAAVPDDAEDMAAPIRSKTLFFVGVWDISRPTLLIHLKQAKVKRADAHRDSIVKHRGARNPNERFERCENMFKRKTVR